MLVFQALTNRLHEESEVQKQNNNVVAVSAFYLSLVCFVLKCECLSAPLISASYDRKVSCPFRMNEPSQLPWIILFISQASKRIFLKRPAKQCIPLSRWNDNYMKQLPFRCWYKNKKTKQKCIQSSEAFHSWHLQRVLKRVQNRNQNCDVPVVNHEEALAGTTKKKETEKHTGYCKVFNTIKVACI